MDKELFFAVWDLPELRALIRSFMWPGKRAATWYEYRDMFAAINRGYVDILKAAPLSSATEDLLVAAITVGNLHMVEHLARCVRPGVLSSVAAARRGDSRIFSVVYNRRATTRVILAALESGNVDILAQLDRDSPKVDGACFADSAIQGGSIDALMWVERQSPVILTLSHLYTAVSKDKLAMCKYIYARTGSIGNSRTIEYAVECGSFVVAQWLYSLGLSPKRASAIICATVGNIAMLEWLYSSVSMGELDDFWHCVADCAARRGSLNVLTWLLERSVKIERKHGKPISYNVNNLLRRALFYGRTEVADYLFVKHGASCSGLFSDLLEIGALRSLTWLHNNAPNQCAAVCADQVSSSKATLWLRSRKLLTST